MVKRCLNKLKCTLSFCHHSLEMSTGSELDLHKVLEQKVNKGAKIRNL